MSGDTFVVRFLQANPECSTDNGQTLYISCAGDTFGRHRELPRRGGLSLENLPPEKIDEFVRGLNSANQQQLNTGSPNGSFNHHHPLLPRLVIDIDTPEMASVDTRDKIVEHFCSVISSVLLEHYSALPSNPDSSYVLVTDKRRVHIYFDAVVGDRSAIGNFFSLVRNRLVVLGYPIDAVKKIIDSAPTLRSTLRMPFVRKKREVSNVYLPESEIDDLAVLSLSPHTELLRDWIRDPIRWR